MQKAARIAEITTTVALYIHPVPQCFLSAAWPDIVILFAKNNTMHNVHEERQG